MIISVKSYADFKRAANTLRHLDAVFYKNSLTMQSQTRGVAYAFDYQAGVAVVALVFGGITFSTDDFPSAIELGAELWVADVNLIDGNF